MTGLIRDKQVTKFLVCGFVLLLAGVSPQAVFGQSRIKVHKKLITVFPPDATGYVLVRGIAGAIESTSQVTAQLMNLRSNLILPLEVNPDGSFEGKIQGFTGQQVRVLAKNRDNKRSYGTFTVPAGSFNAKRETDNIKLPPVVITPPKTGAATKAEKADLAILISVINLKTGQVVTSQWVTGSVQTKSERNKRLALLVKHIIDQCVKTIKKELAAYNAERKPSTTDKLLQRILEVPPARKDPNQPAAKPEN